MTNIQNVQRWLVAEKYLLRPRPTLFSIWPLILPVDNPSTWPFSVDKRPANMDLALPVPVHLVVGADEADASLPVGHGVDRTLRLAIDFLVVAGIPDNTILDLPHGNFLAPPHPDGLVAVDGARLSLGDAKARDFRYQTGRKRNRQNGGGEGIREKLFHGFLHSGPPQRLLLIQRTFPSHRAKETLWTFSSRIRRVFCPQALPLKKEHSREKARHKYNVCIY